MTLTEDQRERYSRMLALRDFNEEDMESIMKTQITMVGAGGLGSAALRLLAAIGFGRITIIDNDIVELSNIQRQTVYNTEDLGRNKAEAASENLGRMNPEVKFKSVVSKIDDTNAVMHIKSADIIVDGLDSFKARRAVNTASVNLRIPYIFAGAVEYYGNLSTFIPGETGCLHCMLRDAKDDPELTCANIGVSPTLLSIVGAIEVREAVLLATGQKPKLHGQLMTIDIDSLAIECFDLKRVDNCPICGKLSSEK
ncbi:MAG: HesA/MoeB/ThiF family protein [Candidatus Thorarchaeota archaeon]